MTQEEKKLLLADLCTRLPYEVKVDHFGTVKELLGIMPSSENVMVGYDINDYEDSVIEDIKPFLRPLSSMTEEEKEELRDTYDWVYSEYPWDDEDEDEDDVLRNVEDVGGHYEPSAETYDWYNRKMFDHRGLIPMGLANESPEGMYI